MRVLVVDDELNACENLKLKLSQIEEITQITTFSVPFEAISYASDNPVDVAFLDIEMYQITGIEMAMRLKAINPRINIIFVTGYSHYALDAFGVNASGYLLKPASVKSIETQLKNLRYPILNQNKGIVIQTFGNFCIFIDKEPLHISRAKVKELLAYLVDKRGTPITTAEIAAALWEDKAYSRSLQMQTQTIISQMMRVLKSVDIDYIIIKKWNSIAIDTKKVICDYYQLLEGNPAAINAYAGEYMNEYSWAEITAGILYNKTKS